MFLQNIKASKVSVKDLLQLIPSDLVKNLSESLNTDKWVRKLDGYSFFNLLIFSILSSERLSLRIMEDNFKDTFFNMIVEDLISDDTVTHTGIRERLKHINVDFFRLIYEHLYKEVEKHYSEQSLSKYNIKRYDSTMVSTFSHLLAGMKVGNTSCGKEQVKFTVEFKNDFQILANLYIEQKYLSEERALKEVITDYSKDDISQDKKRYNIHVFDKGLKSRETFEKFESAGIKFITRLNKNPRYEVLSPNLVPKKSDEFYDTQELEFIQDLNVRLYKKGRNNLTSKSFRLIQFYIKDKSKSKEKLSFITNVHDLTHNEIAQIYRQRWDIEVLFRFMKQEMNLSHFVCNDPNAINIMLYCTLIASTLILIYKKLNNIKSYKQAKRNFFKEMNYLIILEVLKDKKMIKRIRNNLQNKIRKNFSEQP